MLNIPLALIGAIMAPLLLETSLQAQVLIAVVTSIVFGMLTSTMLVL